MAYPASLFGMECSSLKITPFVSETPCLCVLCGLQTHQGHNIGSKINFCNDCFEELKLSISLQIIQEEELN